VAEGGWSEVVKVSPWWSKVTASNIGCWLEVHPAIFNSIYDGINEFKAI
jgi:hypothetical protein